MKKLISLLAAISVVSACSLSAFAMDFTVGDGTLSAADDAAQKIEKGENQLYNVDLTELANGQDQTTILAVKGNTISVGSIQYIGQSATYTFSFDLKDALSEKVYILAGGSDLTPTVVGYIEATPVASGYKVYGYVADNEATVILGETSVKVDSTGAYSFENITTGKYELSIKAPGAFTRKISANVENSDLLIADSENKTTLFYGAVREDATKIEIDDLLLLKTNYGISSADEGYSLAMDFDRNGKIEIDDLLMLKTNYGKTISEAYAE